MPENGKYWSSGNWHVSEGDEDEFIERWTAFLNWTKAENDGFLFARLVRDTTDPGHFVSFASWAGPEAMAGWQGKPEFAEHFGACRALCESVEAGGYVLAVSV